MTSEHAKSFVARKLTMGGMKQGIEWYPRLDVIALWLDDFAAEAVKAECEKAATTLSNILDVETDAMAVKAVQAYIARLRGGE